MATADNFSRSPRFDVFFLLNGGSLSLFRKEAFSDDDEDMDGSVDDDEVNSEERGLPNLVVV